MTPEALQLAFQKSSFVRHFYYFPTIGSTNEKAKLLAGSGAPEGTIVIAEEQTAGRGRNKRTWHSPPDTGIYTSLIFRPDLPASEAFGVLMASALGLLDAVDDLPLSTPAGLKWPNDILAQGKKLAGVLSDVGLARGRVSWCVVGVGLNVNQESFPGELEDKAVSLQMLTGQVYDRTALLHALLEKIHVRYQTLLTKGTEAVLQPWRERSTILGNMVRVETAGETYVGTVAGIEDDGALRVRLESGAEEVLRAADVQLVQVGE